MLQPIGRVTLKDIANRTGFTINTVSRALKDRHDISDATKRIIREMADQLGYVQDSVAGAMRSGTTRTLAVILSDISNPFLAMQVKAIELAAMRSGYSTFILNTDEDSAAELQAIRSAYSKKVDGVLICPVQENEDNIRFLQRTGLPFVLIGRYYPDIPLPAVVGDDRKAGLLAAQDLLERGHRRILLLNGPTTISSARDRLLGYGDAHARAGVTVDEQLIRTVDVRPGQTRAVLGQALAEPVDFTAVIAFSDMLGLEACCLLQESPETASIPVVGFDNIQARLPLPVPFVSVGMIDGDWSEPALQLLYAQMHAKAAAPAPQKIVLDVRLYRHHCRG
jgi:LacI family transcriptional regulator